MALDNINRKHNGCYGESGELCFVFCNIILRFSPLVNSFFKFFRVFVKNFSGAFEKAHKGRAGMTYFTTTSMSIEKSNKNNGSFRLKFLLHTLLHKFFCRFSSQLNIYKKSFLRYNISAVGEYSGRFPCLHIPVPFYVNAKLMTSPTGTFEVCIFLHQSAPLFFLYQKNAFEASNGFECVLFLWFRARQSSQFSQLW